MELSYFSCILSVLNFLLTDIHQHRLSTEDAFSHRRDPAQVSLISRTAPEPPFFSSPSAFKQENSLFHTVFSVFSHVVLQKTDVVTQRETSLSLDSTACLPLTHEPHTDVHVVQLQIHKLPENVTVNNFECISELLLILSASFIFPQHTPGFGHSLCLTAVVGLCVFPAEFAGFSLLFL